MGVCECGHELLDHRLYIKSPYKCMETNEIIVFVRRMLYDDDHEGYSIFKGCPCKRYIEIPGARLFYPKVRTPVDPHSVRKIPRLYSRDDFISGPTGHRVHVPRRHHSAVQRKPHRESLLREYLSNHTLRTKPYIPGPGTSSDDA
jgi:hypothetical protein